MYRVSNYLCSVNKIVKKKKKFNYSLFGFAPRQNYFNQSKGDLRPIQESKFAGFSGRVALTNYVLFHIEDTTVLDWIKIT